MWVWVLIAVGGPMVLGCGGVGVVAVVMWSAGVQPGPGGGVVKRTYTRAEFKSLVVGKTEDEIVAAVGRPDRTDENQISLCWYYTSTTIDPVTGNLDASTQVVFKGGRAHHVNY